MKITATWLDTAIAKNRGKERFRKTVDRLGRKGSLMVTVYGNGAAAFSVRYTRPSGKRVFMPLGPYGDAGLSLAEAGAAYDEALKLLAKDIDPIEERARRQADVERERLERAGSATVGRLVERFVHERLRAERWDEDNQAWVRNLRANIKVRKRPEAAAALLGYYEADKPREKRKGRRKNVPTLISELGTIKARDITKRDLVGFLDGIVARGAPVTANRVHALLLQMFKWAVAKDLVMAPGPMVEIERPGGDENPRDRLLTTADVRTFWAELDTAEMAESTRLALKFLLVTAQRRGEVTFAEWSHFDIENKLWTIPVELLKNSHAKREKPEPHQVPLSPLALELLQKLKTLSEGSKYVLPGAGTRKGNSYSKWVLSRAIYSNAKHFGIARFTPHDLRRTAASFMTKLKVPRLHVSKVLNHSDRDITGKVYDQHDYLPEKREALERWGKHLQEIIEAKDPQKVIALESRRSAVTS
jgi:integrase